MPNIREWMKNKTILITGAAGFLGKVLIEKLLRDCPDVKRIYIIIRSKYGKSPKERWDEITKDELFEKLLTQSPDVLDRKVTVLDGDMSLINLGLSQETIQELKNTVNIIFHSAATVRFNDPLHKAFLSNTRGTFEMCKLASETKSLEVFVHVSTTYCNCNLKKTYYEEKIYEPCQDWRTILKLIEKENPAVMNILSLKILEDHPNTYTFSKSLSEKIVDEYSHKFPTVIARPSVVVGVYSDPIPGWTDNINGILGVTTATSKGVMRVVKGRGECYLDYIPVDVTINALIICAWDKATSENKELSIYNCAYSDITPINFKQIQEVGLDLNENKITLDNDLWYPFILIFTNDFLFHIFFYLLQFLPALLVDSILILLKKKPRLMKITMKIYQAVQALTAFTEKEIKFETKKYKTLWDKLTDDEAEIFKVKPPSDLDWQETMCNLHRGVKKYFLKESLEDDKYHKKKLRRLYYIDRITRGILIVVAFILLRKLINVLMYKYIL